MDAQEKDKEVGVAIVGAGMAGKNLRRSNLSNTNDEHASAWRSIWSEGPRLEILLCSKEVTSLEAHGISTDTPDVARMVRVPGCLYFEWGPSPDSGSADVY